MFIHEYMLLFYFMLVSLIMVLLLFSLSMLGIFSVMDSEKMSMYECGFTSFEDASMPFNVKFYLMGVLFMIFDLEIVFLFTWVLNFFYISVMGHMFFFLFLFVLSMGLIYEWLMGALDM